MSSIEDELLEHIPDRGPETLIEAMDNLVGQISSINDDIDVIPTLLGIRDFWPKLKAALRRAEQMEKALAPFAEIGLDVLKNHPGWANAAFGGDWCGFPLTYAQFEHALAMSIAWHQGVQFPGTPDVPVYFIYRRTATAYMMPQRWNGDQINNVTGKFKHGEVGDPESDLVYFRELGPEDIGLSLLELESKYPCVEGTVIKQGPAMEPERRIERKQATITRRDQRAAENAALERAAAYCDNEARTLNGTADCNAGDAEYRSEARAMRRAADAIRKMMVARGGVEPPKPGL